MGKKMSGFFTLPSPIVGEAPSPFDLNNLIKNKNITGSNMFDEKNGGSIDLFNSGRLSQISSKKEDSFISLVDEIPMYPMDSIGLFKSA